MRFFQKIGMGLALWGLCFPVWAHTFAQEEEDDRYYGRSQLSDFHKAISHGADPLTQKETAALNALVPLKEAGRFYGRARVNWSELEAEKIKNITETGDQENLGVAQNTAKTSQMGFEFAIGYNWENYRIDLEYLLNKNLKYAASPLFSNTGAIVSQDLTASTVATQAFLINAHYDWRAWLIRPYVFVTAGLSLNKVNAQATSGSGQKKIFGLAWGLGIGVRPRIFERWYLDLFYRYTTLGKVKWAPSANGATNPVRLEGRLLLKGFGVGVNFLF